MNKEKVIVTGGSGFIGSHVIDLLIKAGFDVHVIDIKNPAKGRINKKAKYKKKDIRDFREIKPLFKNAKFVFHLAALPRVPFSIEHPIETNETNITGTLNVLKASVDSGVKRVIYSASSSAYGDQKELPLKEGMLANPKSPYGLQKYVGELYCKVFNQVYGLETVSLRYFNVYGPRLDPEGDYALVVGKFLKQKKANKPMTITGDGKQTRDFTNVHDVARANILAMSSKKVGKGEVMNIGAGNGISINHLAKLLGGKVKYIKARLEPKYTEADNSKARKLIGWKPEVSFEKGIKELKEVFGV
jgi:nucleoside-diphosphate-sugar epimerase